jgi:hypothetical protein
MTDTHGDLEVGFAVRDSRCRRPVCLKMCGQFGLEVGEPAVELDDDSDRRAGGRAECRGDRRRRGELLGAQYRHDLLSAGLDVALSPSMFEG